jgi:hypothetical protein
MPDAERRPAEERHARNDSGSPSRAIDGRHEHEDAPQAVDDRRNRREQFRQEDERLRRASGASSEMNTAMPTEIGIASSSASTDEYSVPR